MNIIGSLGGSNLTDKALVGMAPAFKRVRNVALQARGHAGNCFSPESLRAFADGHEGFEFFGLDYYSGPQPGEEPLAPIEEFAEVVLTHPAFRSLKAVVLPGGDAKALKSLPNVVTANVEPNSSRQLPGNAAELARMKA